MIESAPSVLRLPYPGDSAALFCGLLDLPWPAFLDSGHPHYPQARYDILTAAPRVTLTGRAGQLQVTEGARTHTRTGDPFRLLQEILQTHARPPGPLPFAGGALGYFGYDLGHALEGLPQRPPVEPDLPDLALGIYDWAVVVDHQEGRAYLAGRWPPEIPARLGSCRRRPALAFRFLAAPRPDLDPAAYLRAFQRVHCYIRDGDCYQVNLARRFQAPLAGEAWAVYARLRRLSPAPCGAFLANPWGAVLSASPETFLRVRGGMAVTRPIKGTRGRDPDPERDRRLAEALRASPKERAENIMIVDLLRNDLGKVCVPGSIRAEPLLEVESFPQVHHLVSTVTGRLVPGTGAADALRACFPGGSITGAPKHRAMQIIDELEPQRRGVYCGAIGYLGYDGSMDTSIAIRTLVLRQGVAYFWAGGGIVADSDPDAELQETLDKARAMLTLSTPTDRGATDARG